MHLSAKKRQGHQVKAASAEHRVFSFISFYVLAAAFLHSEVFWAVSVCGVSNDAVSISHNTAYVAKLWLASRMTLY
jgi:hypothetical protein